MLIDVAMSGDRNETKNEDWKTVKYKDLTIEIHHMWGVKTKLIPVITRAIGSIAKSFRKCLSKIPGKQDIQELQKSATLCTARYFGKY